MLFLNVELQKSSNSAFKASLEKAQFNKSAATEHEGGRWAPKYLSGGNCTCLMKNWFEGKYSKILLWGKKHNKGCEIQFTDCFTAQVTSVPRAGFYDPCEKSNPRSQGCAALLLKHKKMWRICSKTSFCPDFLKINAVLFFQGDEAFGRGIVSHGEVASAHLPGGFL